MFFEYVYYVRCVDNIVYSILWLCLLLWFMAFSRGRLLQLVPDLWFQAKDLCSSCRYVLWYIAGGWIDMEQSIFCSTGQLASGIYDADAM